MIKKRELLKMRESEGDTLRAYVLEHLLNRFDDYEDICDCIGEILAHGCVSGCVSSLVYYCDTLAFYEKYRDEINSLVYEVCYDYGNFDLSLIFKDWDKEDPLCLNTHNRNLLAWFGFEETLYRIAIVFGG